MMPLAERADNDARSYILAGFAICARLMVCGRADLIVRLAGDVRFALEVSKLALEAFRAPERRNLDALIKAIEARASYMDGAS